MNSTERTEPVCPQPCTTHGRRRMHLSTALRPGRTGLGGMPGASGPTLCGEDGEDQERVNAWRTRFGACPIVVADLPACKLCTRAAAKLSEVPDGR